MPTSQLFEFFGFGFGVVFMVDVVFMVEVCLSSRAQAPASV